MQKSLIEPEIFGIFQHKVERTPHFARVSEVRHIFFPFIRVFLELYKVSIVRSKGLHREEQSKFSKKLSLAGIDPGTCCYPL